MTHADDRLPSGPDVPTGRARVLPPAAPTDALNDRVNRFLGVVMLLPLYAVIMYTLWLPAYEKFFDRDRTVPYYGKVFSGSIIDRIGATDLLITSMGVIEFGVIALLVASLLRGEFLPSRTAAPLLTLGLWLAVVVFAMLGFGLRLLQNHAGTANQFYYLGVTLGILAFVQYWKRRTARS